MKKLCFGTVFTLLCNIKNDKYNQSQLYGYLTILTDSYLGTDAGTVSSRKKGEDDIPSIDKHTINETELSKIVIKYRDTIELGIINDEYKKAYIAAIRDIISDDESIDENTVIGSEDNTAYSINKNNTFDFSVFLANLMKYCSLLPDNRGFCSSIEEIKDKAYINSFLNKTKDIYLEKLELYKQTPLEISIDSTKFNDIFNEINPGSYRLSIPNPNRLKIFKLRLNNKEFDKNNVADFIVDNIGRYVFSRTKRNDLNTPSNVEKIALKAFSELNTKNPSKQNNFAEIMLYSFLECSMYAPKIYSGIELNTTNLSQSKSSGIYLLPAGTICPNNQIIYGCSKVLDTLKDAIDNVLSQAITIKDNFSKELKLLDPYILNQHVSDETTTFIRSIVIPSKTSTADTDNAFGIFVTYDVQIENKINLSSYEYKNELDKKLDIDIKEIIPYITNEINRLALQDYSFYFFILPLDNSIEDTEKIMDISANGGTF